MRETEEEEINKKLQKIIHETAEVISNEIIDEMKYSYELSTCIPEGLGVVIADAIKSKLDWLCVDTEDNEFLKLLKNRKG